MDISEKLAPIRKGLLEFVILKIVAGDKVYVADMLKLLGPTEFATQEGTLYPLLSASCGAKNWWTTSGRSPKPARRASTTSSRRRAARSLSTLNDYWKDLNRTLADFGN